VEITKGPVVVGPGVLYTPSAWWAINKRSASSPHIAWQPVRLLNTKFAERNGSLECRPKNRFCYLYY